MKIVSYNVNSLRKRLHLIEELIQKESPQILCLQEIKISSEKDFSFDFFERFGYKDCKFQLSDKGQGGVLIASKSLNLDAHCSFNFLEKNEDSQLKTCSQRHISVQFTHPELNEKIELHNLYVPSGGSGAEEADLTSPKFLEKLDFFEAMAKFFEKNKSNNQIILGDLNIAPFENDVFNHKQLLKIISHTPQETKLFEDLILKADLKDSARIFFPDNEKIFSWWSYRSKNWEQTNRGRRLDHILVSSNLAGKIKGFRILTEFRKKESPSDHCPVLIEI